MVTAADTSFLFSLYGNDDHSGKSVEWVSRHSQVLTLSVLNEFEFANALRFAEFKKFLPQGNAAEFYEDFCEDVRCGRLVIETCNLARVIEEAMRVSSHRTSAGGHRSFDILHVAGAMVMEAELFLTFDQNQARLASSVGLNVPEYFV